LAVFGTIHLEVGAEDVGAVEVRRGPRIAQVLGVVAGEEQADVALFVEGVAPGVAGAGLEVVRETLFRWVSSAS
jgi:hypothetical protein